MIWGVNLRFFVLHAPFHLWHVCVRMYVCSCVCQHCVWQWWFSLSALNWLIMVTAVTVLWKSSSPTTTEMPPAHLNVIVACCLHLSRRLARQFFVQCLSYWLTCFAVSCFEGHIDTSGVFVAVACMLKLAVVMLRVTWGWFAWVYKISFAWTLLHIILDYVYTSASITMCTNWITSLSMQYFPSKLESAVNFIIKLTFTHF